MKRLAVFDIDGTLTDTNSIDSECFLEAIQLEYGIRNIDEDWSTYPHTTDRAILKEVLRRAWSRDAAEHELDAHRKRFAGILAERMTNPRQIPGAAAFLDIVRAEGWSIVLCTGAWTESARLKLSRSGFPDGLPISSSDATDAREDIVRKGIAMSGDGFDRIVVFGDAVWDVRTARNLGLPFIGVGSRSGAEAAIDDYTDAARVLALMLEARAPR